MSIFHVIGPFLGAVFLGLIVYFTDKFVVRFFLTSSEGIRPGIVYGRSAAYKFFIAAGITLFSAGFLIIKGTLELTDPTVLLGMLVEIVTLWVMFLGLAKLIDEKKHKLDPLLNKVGNSLQGAIHTATEPKSTDEGEDDEELVQKETESSEEDDVEILPEVETLEPEPVEEVEPDGDKFRSVLDKYNR